LNENKKVSIIIINYKNVEETIHCINSLKRVNYPNYSIVVVDNNSNNGSVEKLRDIFNNDIFIIESYKNLGFAGGNNLGIRYALKFNPDYILLINNDTEVEPDFLSIMVNSFKEDSLIGMVSPKIMFYDKKDRVWFGGGNISWLEFTGKHEKNPEKVNRKRYITFATGCCILIKREVIERVGLLPEEYFMYFEDFDYSLQVQRSGYKILYEPAAVIYHKVGSSGGGNKSEFFVIQSTKSHLIILNKYRKNYKLSIFISYFFFLINSILKFFYYLLIKREIRKSLGVIRGIKEYLKYKKELKCKEKE